GVARRARSDHEAAQHLTTVQRAGSGEVVEEELSTVLVDQLHVEREQPAVAAERHAAAGEVVTRAPVGQQHVTLAVEHDDRNLERGQQLVARERPCVVVADHAPGLTTNSPKRVTARAGSRARMRLPPSACTSTSTSPSRWSAATTSPRSYGTCSST